jgi:hypothetical protein
MKMQLVGVLSFLVVLNAYSYEKYVLQPGEKKEGATYYTDDGKYAVILTQKERRTIEFILKQQDVWSDQSYNTVINDQYIKLRSGGCCSQCGKSACADVSQCTSCSPDAKLLIQVLTDFKGKTVRILFDKLNLRNEL